MDRHKKNYLKLLFIFLYNGFTYYGKLYLIQIKDMIEKIWYNHLRPSRTHRSPLAKISNLIYEGTREKNYNERYAIESVY